MDRTVVTVTECTLDLDLFPALLELAEALEGAI
jgi:hypothetical protein